MNTDDLDTLAAFQLRMLAMPARRVELIRQCRDNGRTWQQIADALDMTVRGARRVVGA